MLGVERRRRGLPIFLCFQQPVCFSGRTESHLGCFVGPDWNCLNKPTLDIRIMPARVRQDNTSSSLSARNTERGINLPPVWQALQLLFLTQHHHNQVATVTCHYNQIRIGLQQVLPTSLECQVCFKRREMAFFSEIHQALSWCLQTGQGRPHTLLVFTLSEATISWVNIYCI